MSPRGSQRKNGLTDTPSFGKWFWRLTLTHTAVSHVRNKHVSNDSGDRLLELYVSVITARFRRHNVPNIELPMEIVWRAWCCAQQKLASSRIPLSLSSWIPISCIFLGLRMFRTEKITD
jgi:hypothetical protein